MLRFNKLMSRTGRPELREIAWHLGFPPQCSKWSEEAWKEIEKKAVELGPLEAVKSLCLIFALTLAGCNGLNNPVSTGAAKAYVTSVVPAECKKEQNGIKYVKVGCEIGGPLVGIVSDSDSSVDIDGVKHKPALNPEGVL
jgi:hypothetical protein